VKGAIVLRHTDKEVDMDDDFDATPRQQDIQMLHTDTDTDMGLEDVQPYETPVVLQRKKKRMVSELAIELSDDETEKSLLKKGKKKKRIASAPAFELSEDDETEKSLSKKGNKKKRIASAPAFELSDDETEKSLLKGKKKKRITSVPAFELSEDDETGESLLKKGKKENKGKGKEPANKTKVRSMIVDRFG
jgi:hypothetical protein